ncbi:MAG: hypothetical protein U5P10_06895 [Spirochaetia bacterium]|nr:hypothetical protein [Spirochaetia bacterium]
MNRKLLFAINLSAIILLLALIGYILLTLVSSYRLNTSDARLDITRTSVQAKSLFSVTTGSAEQELNNFRNSLIDNAQIKSLVLYGRNGELIYVYARNPSYLKISQGSEQFSRSSVHLPYNNLYETIHKVELNTDNRLIAEGVYQLFSPNYLLSLAKQLFLVLSVLTLFLLIFVIVTSRRSFAEYPSNAGEKETAPAGGSSDTAFQTSAVSSAAVAHPATQTESEESLYTPDSGLCFEQYLEERLSNELRRAASFDQDLVTALIKCKGAVDNRSTYIQLAKKLKEHFTFHDLLFEVQNDKMAVILPSSDLEQGITELSDFQKELFQATPDMFCASDISIGLSSRNGRLINSDRILKEAHAALKRAEEDSETNLIGFRPDPGKFRSFLAMQNK